MQVVTLTKFVVAGAAVAGGLVLGSTTSATAAPPNNGCPTGYVLKPVSFLGPNFTGVADNVNHDGFICARGQVTPLGTHFSITDNTTP
jgi:hypothetical protein